MNQGRKERGYILTYSWLENRVKGVNSNCRIRIPLLRGVYFVTCAMVFQTKETQVSKQFHHFQQPYTYFTTSRCISVHWCFRHNRPRSVVPMFSDVFVLRLEGFQASVSMFPKASMLYVCFSLNGNGTRVSLFQSLFHYLCFSFCFRHNITETDVLLFPYVSVVQESFNEAFYCFVILTGPQAKMSTCFQTLWN